MTSIGIPREIKAQEGRVALLPHHVARLRADDLPVLVQSGAGEQSGASDQDYTSAGAELVADAQAVYAGAELIVKVKEILPPEYPWLQARHVILTNIHGAGNRDQLDQLLQAGLIAIAAEDTHPFGSPNGPLAGEVGALEGVRLLLAPHGGGGRHFMAHYGAAPAAAVVMGLGAVGRGALRVLLGLGLDVTGFDLHPGARRDAELAWHDRRYRSAPLAELAGALREADLIVNCVRWDKTRNDHLVSRAMLRELRPRAVIVDIACDEGGAIESSRPTTWADPVYTCEGIRHFCVDNLPGAVPATASAGYGDALLPRVSAIARLGALEACRRDPWLARGLTCVGGVLTLEEAGRVQDRSWTPVQELLGTTP